MTTIDKRDVIAVYDVYDRRHFVNSVDLARGKTMLRCYRRNGEWREGVVIHRENLVSHQVETLKATVADLLAACEAVAKYGAKGQMPDGRYSSDLCAEAAARATA